MVTLPRDLDSADSADRADALISSAPSADVDDARPPPASGSAVGGGPWWWGLPPTSCSRLCVLAGAGVRASALAVEANVDGYPPPGSPARLAFETFGLWDARWYLEIVRLGYPRDIPADVTFFDVEARAAFFPLYPLVVRALDRVLPSGEAFAALAVNLVLGLVATLLVGLLARRLYDDTVAERAMVLFAVFPGSFVLTFAYAEALLIVLAALLLLVSCSISVGSWPGSPRRWPRPADRTAWRSSRRAPSPPSSPSASAATGGRCGRRSWHRSA